MRADYPLLLTPHFAERVWGGDRLGAGIGEAWDLSVHPHGPCRIESGPLRGKTLAEVADARPEDFGGPIRLLAKRLDCRADLSFQVHPVSEDPKTESWVVLDAAHDAGVWHGFRRTVTADEVRAAARDGSLPGLLRFEKLAAGASVFVPSGTVHAIGAGLFLFELQQSADTTYRLFDWGRGRELHLDQALANARLDALEAQPAVGPGPEGRTRLAECDHFFIDRIDEPGDHRLEPGGNWVAAHLLDGEARAGDVGMDAGSTLMVPAAAGACSLRAGGVALVYGPG
ncbi:MAG: type I phosphomannose isomerase catalytic subunit [Planctomycetota bacterium]|jgi:mannose-6-phosphate isomerase